MNDICNFRTFETTQDAQVLYDIDIEDEIIEVLNSELRANPRHCYE